MARDDPAEAGQWIRSRSIRVQLVAALDHWAYLLADQKLPGGMQLLAVARAADPDPWRDRLRDALARGDSKAVEELVASGLPDELPPLTRDLLFRVSMATLKAERVLSLLRQMQQRHPDDFWLNHELASRLHSVRPPRLEEAIRYYTAAVAIRPKSHEVHFALGNALKDSGHLDEAVVEYREAMRGFNSHSRHILLGNTLREKGELDEAIAEFREVVRNDRDDGPHDPNVLYQSDADCAVAHLNLSNALIKKGLFQDAVKELRRANELNSHISHLLSRHPDIGFKQSSPPAKVQAMLRHAEQLARLDDRLSAILASKAQPKDAAERVAFAQLCQLSRKRHAASARFYEEAFRGLPALADDLDQQHRYNAACAAALAGCGKGEDAQRLDAKEKARWRHQALDWLRADLKAYRQMGEKSADRAGPEVARRLQHWLRDEDFAGVRGPEALARLPEAERQEWQELWQEVEALKDRAAGTAAPKSPDRPPDKR